MKKTKKIINNLKRIIIKNKFIFLVLIFALIIGKVAIPRIFAQLQPVKSVEILSEKLDYTKKEPGSWKIDKSAKWISKGNAEITFDLDTITKENNKYVDIIFVLDISGSMEGEKLDRVKSDTTELINSILVNEENRASIITFDTNSQLVLGLTNNRTDLITAVNNLTTGDTTNYYQALVNVDNILKEYENNVERKCVVLFLTDGYPNEETPNEEWQYSYLKNQYPFLTINGIQYEMGSVILDPIKKVSDKQFFADVKTLNNILFEASTTAENYENFEISDYVDTNYFTVENSDDISVSQGKITFDKDQQKISWNIEELKSGSKANMKIKVKLKEEFIDKGGIYPTNEKEEIKSKINDSLEDINSPKTPVLSDNYKVTYDGNLPEGCSNTTIPDDERHSVFDVVQISDTKISCDGYQFKGWKITNKNIQKINDEYFNMPEEDVMIRGEWSKIAINKSLEGKMYKVETLQKVISDGALPDDVPSEFVTGEKGIEFDKSASDTNGKGLYVLSSTKNDKYPIYYYRGDVANNNVLYANMCWKIVRTTSTGGTKLIYNGLPDENNKCSNTSDATIGKGYYNSRDTIPQGVGYTYGTYPNYTMAVASEEWIYSSTRIDNNRYYSDTVNYENGVYSFENSTKIDSSSYESLVGKYVYSNVNENHTSTEAYYVAAVSGSIMYYIRLYNGNLLDYYNKLYTLGDAITENEDGTFTLENSFTIEKKDWYNNYNRVNVGYYICEGESATCSKPKYVVSVDNDEFAAIDTTNKYVYGNSFTYENGKYTLKDTVSFWNYSENYEQLKQHHYTCLNTSGVCTSLYYIYNSEGNRANSVRLSNGDSIEDAINVMKSNQKDSEAKKAIDSWYESNLLDYTDYLEDTIWCNDRSVFNKDTTGWNPNGGSTTEDLYFGANGRIEKSPIEFQLTCPNKNDSFTVSSENGNGYLKYPSALITADEIVLAGHFGARYLSSSSHLWTMTPNRAGSYFARMFDSSSALSENEIFNVFGYRPMISIKNDVKVNGGTGLADSPYILDLATKYKISIQTENADIIPTKNEALVGGIITLTSVSGNYEVASFKLNGTLVEGNSFEMPEEDAVITDVITIEKNSN